jgi:hypothetical protein
MSKERKGELGGRLLWRREELWRRENLQDMTDAFD